MNHSLWYWPGTLQSRNSPLSATPCCASHQGVLGRTEGQAGSRVLLGRLSEPLQALSPPKLQQLLLKAATGPTSSVSIFCFSELALQPMLCQHPHPLKRSHSTPRYLGWCCTRSLPPNRPGTVTILSSLISSPSPGSGDSFLQWLPLSFLGALSVLLLHS